MNFNILNRNYLEKRVDHRSEKWNCYNCNCNECPFQIECEKGNGKPSDFFKQAIKEIERLS